MKKRAAIISILLLGFILLPNCRGNPPASPEISLSIVISATPTIPSEGHSVVLVSWDGSRADFVYDLMDEGRLPAFTSLAARGVRAEYVQSIDPSLTAAAHNSISSGSYPARTGITSNSYHITGDGSRLAEIQTIFIAAGHGVPLANSVIPPIRIVDYEPTIALLPGFTPAAPVDGSIIPSFMQP